MCERDFSAESMMFPNLKQKDPITQANMKLSGKSKPEFSIFFFPFISYFKSNT